MTVLNIDIVDILSETDPDDAVFVWSPTIRGSDGSTIINTRRKRIGLVDGVGSDDVVPGPMFVQIDCKGMSDTRTREVVVPDQSSVTLAELLEDTYTYSPTVLTSLSKLRREVFDARDEALEAVSDAEIARALGQYRGTGFPNGVVTAPVGSIYTDTAATAGAIRWIKETGVGNTGWRVMDGDTGTRLMPDSMMENGWTIKLGFLCTLRRVGNTVSVSWDVSPPLPNHDTIGTIPAGFRPSIGEVNILSPAGLAISTAHMNIIVSPDGEWRRYSGRSSDTTSPVSGSTSWITTDPWPTSLPGTPA